MSRAAVDTGQAPPRAGMPALDASAETLSFFEFWPPSLFYLPIPFYWAWLTLKHGSSTLPTAANPDIEIGGLIGESKYDVFEQITGTARDLVPPYTRIDRTDGGDGVAMTLTRALARMRAAGLTFPVVAKPDLGMRGAGVQVARDRADLAAYIAAFPAGARFVLQELVEAEGEAGVYYVRRPGEPAGRLFSLTLKYFPYVTGDGRTTLRHLIERSPRAGRIAHLYLDRHQARLDDIVPEGQAVRLAFAGSHSRGAIFRNGHEHITPAMSAAFDRVSKSMGEFYMGRFDVRFEDFEALKAGHGFKIIEVNGAGGEATHIWDSRTRLRDAYATLFEQFRLLFEIGAENRQRGFEPTTPLGLIRAHLYQRRLTKAYPLTH